MERERILLAGGSQDHQRLLMEILGQGYSYCSAAGEEEIMDLLARRGDIDLILLDQGGEQQLGSAVLERLGSYHWLEELPVILLSDTQTGREVERAYELGATDHICRPFNAAMLRRRVRNTLDLYAKQRRLESLVAEQIRAQERNNDLMVDVLSHIVEFRNSESGQHTLRIRLLTRLLLDQLCERTDSYGLQERDCARIVTASALHDIGKISIPEQILNKPEALSEAESLVIREHTTVGEQILRELAGHREEPLIQTAAEICRWHHERYDGRGYPDGLIGEQIPISAQVVALADVYDALTGERCYKEAYDHDTALGMILGGACGAFNPLLLDCLQEVAPRIRESLFPAGEGSDQSREAERLARELVHVQARTREDRARQLLRLAQERAEFYAACAGGVQFSYDVRSRRCTLTDRKSTLSGGEQSLELEQVYALYPTDEGERQRIREALAATTPRNSSFSMELSPAPEQNGRWRRVHARTLWSGDGHYLGVIGQLSLSSRETEPQNEPGLTASAAVELTRAMEETFDLVRFVDPCSDRILDLDGQGHLHPTDRPRTAFWDHGEDSLAYRAFAEQGTRSKVEFSNAEMYYILAKYVRIAGTPCVLELVSHIQEGRWIDAGGTRFLLERGNEADRGLLTDPLTGAYSRRYLESYRTHLEGMESVAILDVNDFKHINDGYGHTTGDAALREIAGAVQSCIRSTDIMIRYGGDEFLLLFPRMTQEDLQLREEQIRQAVRAVTVAECPAERLSVSIGGVCGIHPLSQAIEEADRRMYVDKKAQKSRG